MSLHDIQTRVHVGKDKRNDFGGYNYRTAEGILAAAKAALPDGATIVVSDQMQEVAGQIFVTATATITLADGTAHSASGHAMHPLTKKGMDPSQITGAASSYARKYALGGLLALDDGSVDPDAAKEKYQPEEPEFDAPSERDRLKAALSKQTVAAHVKKLYEQPNFSSVLSKLPEPMQLEIKAAYNEKMNALLPDDPAMQGPH